MSFWTGFLAGIVATYVVSVAAAFALIAYLNRREEPAPTFDYAAQGRAEMFDDSSAETVAFTHVTNLGGSVKGDG